MALTPGFYCGTADAVFQIVRSIYPKEDGLIQQQV